MTGSGAFGPTRAQIERFAEALGRLAPAGKVALAVSGGPDSVALLLLAQRARPGSLIAATVDHGLRREAAQEARVVARLCARVGVPHATLRVTMTKDGQGMQAAAREARYAALGSWAEGEGARALATAHHLDDQAETLLMRMARGSGIAGLSGIRQERGLAPEVRLIRPLLGWRRAELGAIVAAAGITPVDDPSNRDPRFDRTRARALLAEGWLDPVRLAASATHLADAERALVWTAEREWSRRVSAEAGEWRLDPDHLPDELLRRLVARIVREVLGEDAVTPGPDLTRLIDRLRSGEHATLSGVAAAPGARWRFRLAPPRRTGGAHQSG